jgi:hypothetical protein
LESSFASYPEQDGGPVNQPLGPPGIVLRAWLMVGLLSAPFVIKISVALTLMDDLTLIGSCAAPLRFLFYIPTSSMW